MGCKRNGINVITTTDAKRNVVTPELLQNGRKYPCGRPFMSPSSTEDIVQVYAEAAIKEVCT